MPELPDLEVFSHNLNTKLKNKKISKVKVVQTRKLKVSAATLRKNLEQQTVKSIYRCGKELFLECKDGTVLSIHLMLRGKLEWFNKKNTHKFTIVELLFSNGLGLAITDYQKQATPTLNPEPNEVPDALSKKANTAFFKQLLQSSNKPVKAVLTDQSKIRGIGNAYADEIFYHAGIHPLSISNKIPANKVGTLVRSIRTVLNSATKQIRKVQPDIIGGELRDFMKVHGSKKKTSPSGVNIQQQSLNGRKTYFTSEQELYK